jgi:hypothetical protein
VVVGYVGVGGCRVAVVTHYAVTQLRITQLRMILIADTRDAAGTKSNGAVFSC